MKKSKEYYTSQITYNLEVEYEPGKFEDNMSFLTDNPKEAYKRLIEMKRDYPHNKIKIIRIAKVTTHMPISEKRLEAIAKTR